MNIVVLTGDEPLYLPAFFDRFLQKRAGDVQALFTVPPLYGKDSTWTMVRKYTAAFGLWNLLILVRRTLHARIADRLRLGASRGRYHSIAAVAAAHRVPCELVPNVNDPAFLQRLRNMNTDLIVSVSCPQLFRKPLIELPPRGCLNVHGALLPRYRGIAPSFWMMVHGEQTAGVTVFFVNEDIDAGDVVEVVDFPIGPAETLEQFIVRSKQIACDTLLRAIDKIESGEYQTRPLDKQHGSYFGFPTRQAYREFRSRGRRLW